jgi:formate-dependent nitrite reductase membrane component NrfD
MMRTQEVQAPSRNGQREAPPTYYRYPALKNPPWRWKIVLYFFTGGLASGAYLAATLADLFGKPEDRPVSRVGRLVALASLAVSPVFLISDLGRPERFANMMRIFKTRSPMSLGAWGLAAFGLFTGAGVVRQAVEDGWIGSKSLPARLLSWVPLTVSGVAGTLAAFFVGSYTGVLIGFTNVPLWAKTSLLQAPLFLTSALASGLAAISTGLPARGEDSPRVHTWLDRTERMAAMGEVALMNATIVHAPRHSDVLKLPKYMVPLRLVPLLSIGLPFILRRRAKRADAKRARMFRFGAGLSVLSSAFIVKAVMVLAGQESGKRPEEYMKSTSGGI